MELEEDLDVLDPERLIQCPLVKHHWIRARRFPYHLVKCKESNPEIAKKLATCPFNARHLVPQAELSNHIMNCNDKAFVEQDVVSRSCESPQEQLNNGSTWQAPPCAEDWETDLLEGSESTFVWGVINSTMNSTISDQNNSLPSRMRPPETLPYSVSAGLIRSISSSPWNLVLPQQ
ncbi:gametocyte-specific factor 1-like [Pyrgilauda ruficollis]|uniref:gametocyte-specific factor 1-like n=1 Tax=Onychostruthus taczanowskii TaxID=356909 RepID=UPI001B7FFC81|nr:gametocyte-specific factor 1-like [Onychostruthus taczanowskii]XP_041317937.1 gametocyte-specific factor 1-like [Pyrgilauda ruficollis]